MSAKRRTSTLGIYHIVLRGVNKQRIFEEKEDYKRFLTTTHRYLDKCRCKMLAYCLMSNHIHLLINGDEEDITSLFKCIGPSFVRWYNEKYQRVGHLFQSRFKSVPVNDCTSLLHVIRYIHQNPVKAALCKKPGQYEYSSFQHYFDNEMIDTEIVQSLFSEEEFYEFNQMENDDHYMDIDDEMPRAVNDKKALEIMMEISGCENASEFQKLERGRRNAALREMNKAGISNKQSSRITGISLGIVQRAVKA